MDIQTNVDGDTAEITLSGDLVASVADELRQQAIRLLEEKVTRVLLNMRCVDFIDSSGLNVCFETHKQLRERSGVIVFLAPTRAVSRIFKLTGASQKLKIAATRDEAISYMKGDRN